MRSAGLDIGSRTIKLTIIENGEVIDHSITDTGVDALRNAQAVMKDANFDRIAATGYGRYLAQANFNCPIITEIKAYALGAHYLFPNCQLVIDIGGQDSKIIRTDAGRVREFDMNDRCAAGTGRFLEIMAVTLGYSISEIGKKALGADSNVSINSMCTVFAESEVVSLISRGENPANIAHGLHQSIVNRIYSLIGMIDSDVSIVFAGGVAKNPCIVKLLEQKLGKRLLVPDEPQILGAIGAALFMQKN